jgi:hypothetical protein
MTNLSRAYDSNFAFMNHGRFYFFGEQEEDYRRFEQLLREIIDGEDCLEKTKERNGGGKEEQAKVGIKDW